MNHSLLLESYPDILTAQDLMHILHISRAGAYNLMNTPDFPTLHVGRSKRVLKARLIDWLQSHSNP